MSNFTWICMMTVDEKRKKHLEFHSKIIHEQNDDDLFCGLRIWNLETGDLIAAELYWIFFHISRVIFGASCVRQWPALESHAVPNTHNRVESHLKEDKKKLFWKKFTCENIEIGSIQYINSKVTKVSISKSIWEHKTIQVEHCSIIEANEWIFHFEIGGFFDAN